MYASPSLISGAFSSSAQIANCNAMATATSFQLMRRQFELKGSARAVKITMPAMA
jgi:hypothetical protein